MRIIDFHTHAFSDSIAERAMVALSATDGVTAYHAGTISSLLASMDSAGIESSIICSIATKPSQFDPILEWSCQIRSERIIPLLSVHPDDKDLKEKMRITREEGFVGIKLHPYYQQFYFDEDRVMPIYEAAAKYGLVIVTHAGYDFAFPDRELRCNPKKIVSVSEQFPELLLVASHLGGWEDWDAVEESMLGLPIYMELSFAPQSLPAEKLKAMLEKHNSDYLLFGTDSPWTDQVETVSLVKVLGLSGELQEKLFYKNALRLLGRG